MQLIPLEIWAEQRYPLARPHVQTLRKWARQGRIHPAPKKHGRAYYVEPTAEYLSDETLVERMSGAAQTR